MKTVKLIFVFVFMLFSCAFAYAADNFVPIGNNKYANVFIDKSSIKSVGSNKYSASIRYDYTSQGKAAYIKMMLSEITDAQERKYLNDIFKKVSYYVENVSVDISSKTLSVKSIANYDRNNVMISSFGYDPTTEAIAPNTTGEKILNSIISLTK
jgi:hypothetical protein